MGKEFDKTATVNSLFPIVPLLYKFISIALAADGEPKQVKKLIPQPSLRWPNLINGLASQENFLVKPRFSTILTRKIPAAIQGITLIKYHNAEIKAWFISKT